MANFEKGDFVTWINKPGSFGIYEGNNLNETSIYTKRLSLALFFDPSKYTETEEGYKSIPVLDVARGVKKVEKTIDTEKEDYWWHKATPLEKRNAIEKLLELGYQWDEETMSIIDIESGEIIKRIITPKIEYKGELVKPVSNVFKEKLMEFVKIKNKNTDGYQKNYYLQLYDNGYNNDDDCYE